MDYDVSWKNPGKEQLDALDFVYSAMGIKKPQLDKIIDHHLLVSSQAMGRAWSVDAGIHSGDVFRINEYELAEMILLAKDSLWYTQAKSWSETPPTGCPITWQLACRFICQVIESDECWWRFDKLEPARLEMGRLLLLDFRQMLDQYRKYASSGIVSTGFYPLIDLICNKSWKAKIRKQAREAQPYTATKCVKPDCDNLVAPIGIEPQAGHFRNYRATGACEKGHNGYRCSKCNAPHSYASGVGKEHLKYSDTTDMKEKSNDVYPV